MLPLLPLFDLLPRPKPNPLGPPLALATAFEVKDLNRGAPFATPFPPDPELGFALRELDRDASGLGEDHEEESELLWFISNRLSISVTGPLALVAGGLIGLSLSRELTKGLGGDKGV